MWSPFTKSKGSIKKPSGKRRNETSNLSRTHLLISLPSLLFSSLHLDLHRLLRPIPLSLSLPPIHSPSFDTHSFKISGFPVFLLWDESLGNHLLWFSYEWVDFPPLSVSLPLLKTTQLLRWKFFHWKNYNSSFLISCIPSIHPSFCFVKGVKWVFFERRNQFLMRQMCNITTRREKGEKRGNELRAQSLTSEPNDFHIHSNRIFLRFC